jgi:hypothetical protein
LIVESLYPNYLIILKNLKNMTTSVSTTKKEQSVDSSSSKQKGIENHKKAAKHHEAAAKHHLAAASHHEKGNYEKACVSAVSAHGNSCLASETERENVKLQALSSSTSGDSTSENSRSASSSVKDSTSSDSSSGSSKSSDSSSERSRLSNSSFGDSSSNESSSGSSSVK